MRVLQIVNTADAQSIPLEVATRLPLPAADVLAAGFYAQTAFPQVHGATKSDLEKPDDKQAAIVLLNAKNALDFAAIARLWRVIDDFDPDVIHLHHTVSTLLATWMVVLRGKKRVLIKTEHNDRRHQGLAQTLVNAVTYPFFRYVITNSDETQRSLKPWEKRVLKNKVATIYNGVNTSLIESQAGRRQEMRDRLGISDDVFLLGAVGRLVPQKNYERALEGFAKAVGRSEKPMRMLIIGQGPLEEALRSQVADLGISQQVIFAGALAREDVYAYLSAIDGMLMASIFEGFCNAAVEAVMAGAPICASGIQTLREVLQSHPIHVDPYSTDDIARGLLEMASMPAQERAMRAEKARDFAYQNYSITSVCQKYVDLYRTVLSGGVSIPSGEAAAR